MASQRLVYGTDYTLSRNRLTLTATPTAGLLHEFSYSFIPEGATTHAHTKEGKSDWTLGNTWDLGHVPDLGELELFRPQLGVTSWWVYGDVMAKNLRRMLHNSTTGAFVEWSTAAITGFTDDANEQVTWVQPHPTNLNLAYVATKVTGGASRLYRWNGSTLTLVASVATTSETHITSIYVEQANPNLVWFTVGGTSALGALAILGLYHATDGVTFTKVSDGWEAGTNPNNVYGALAVIIKEAAPRRVWVLHQYIDPPGAGSVSDLDYSDDEGVTFTQLTNCAWVSDEHQDWYLTGYPYGTDAVVYSILARDPTFFGNPNAWENRWTRATGLMEQTRPLSGNPLIGGGYQGGMFAAGNIVCLEAVPGDGGGDGGNGDLYSSAGFGLPWTKSAGSFWVPAGPSGSEKAIGGAGFRGTGQRSIHGTKNWMVVIRQADANAGRLTVDGGVTWQDIALPGAGRGVGFVKLSG